MGILEFILIFVAILVGGIVVIFYLGFKFEKIELDNQKEKEIKKMYKDFGKVNKTNVKGGKKDVRQK